MLRDFVCGENRKYKMGLGKTIASSLAGFLAGAVVASIIWYLAIYLR